MLHNSYNILEYLLDSSVSLGDGFSPIGVMLLFIHLLYFCCSLQLECSPFSILVSIKLFIGLIFLFSFFSNSLCRYFIICIYFFSFTDIKMCILIYNCLYITLVIFIYPHHNNFPTSPNIKNFLPNLPNPLTNQPISSSAAPLPSPKKQHKKISSFLDFTGYSRTSFIFYI